MKRFLTITILMLLSVCLLCSCSSDKDEETTTTAEPAPVYTYFEDAGGVIPKPDSVNDTVTFKTDKEDETDGKIMHVYTYPYGSTDDAADIVSDYLDVVRENEDLTVVNSYSLNSSTGVWKVKKDSTELCWIISSPGTLSVKFTFDPNASTAE